MLNPIQEIQQKLTEWEAAAQHRILVHTLRFNVKATLSLLIQEDPENAAVYQAALAAVK